MDQETQVLPTEESAVDSTDTIVVVSTFSKPNSLLTFRCLIDMLIYEYSIQYTDKQSNIQCYRNYPQVFLVLWKR